MLPSVLWGAEFCSGSVPAVRLLDRAIRRWSRCLLGWPRGSPIPAVHLESGWPDTQRLVITGWLLSLFGRITSMPIGDCSPLPATVSRVMASCPGSLLATCSDLCTSLEIVTPSSFGVGPGCSVLQVRAWFTQCVAPPLDRALRDRLLVATAALTVHHVDLTTFTVNRGADPVVYSWSSSPSNARFGDSSLVVGLLDIWDVDPSCVLCGAATGDLFIASQCALSSQIYGCNGAAGVPSPLTAPLSGSSTRGSSTVGLT